MSTDEEMLDEETEEVEEEEEVEPSVGEDDEVVTAFAAMRPEERAEILSELLGRYCPECGSDHTSCACESLESLDDGN